MDKMNNEALWKTTYGLYVLTTRLGEKDNGCIINVAQQVTDNPLQFIITVNKKNLTHGMICASKQFNLNLLTEQAPMKIFEHFGFQSGADVDKFAHCEVKMRASNGVLYIPKYTNAYISAEVVNTLDLGTHSLFVARVTEAVRLNDDPSLTYAYYRENIKPKPQMPESNGNGKTIWVCQTCGYVYEGEEIPADFICPWCKHAANDFIKIEKQ